MYHIEECNAAATSASAAAGRPSTACGCIFGNRFVSVINLEQACAFWGTVFLPTTTQKQPRTSLIFKKGARESVTDRLHKRRCIWWYLRDTFVIQWQLNIENCWKRHTMRRVGYRLIVDRKSRPVALAALRKCEVLSPAAEWDFSGHAWGNHYKTQSKRFGVVCVCFWFGTHGCQIKNCTITDFHKIKYFITKRLFFFNKE